MKKGDAWDIYFATLVGMSMHPGYGRNDQEAPTISECAHIADRMLAVRDQRRTRTCQSGQQE